MILAVLGGAWLIWQALTRGDRSRLAVAALLPAVAACEGFVLRWVVTLTPQTYDAQLARWDAVEPAVVRWAAALPPVDALLTCCYYSLPLVMMLGLAAARGRLYRRMLWSMGLAALLAVPIYILCPAVGPAHIGEPLAPRNCVPSLHLAWAAIVWLNLQGWARQAAGVFVILTALATLSTGEHYVIDLIAAVPFIWAVQTIAGRLVNSEAV
jgi:hypothetical protein